MQVLMVTTSFPRHRGDSAGIFILSLSKGLVELGVKVKVLAPHYPGVETREIMESVEVWRIQYMYPRRWQTLCYGDGILYNLYTKPRRYLMVPILWISFLMKTLFNARAADLIHVHWSQLGLAALVAGRLAGKPVILMLHHGQGEKRLKGLTKFVVEHVDAVVCNSSHNYERATTQANPKYCRVIPLGVDTERFHPRLRKRGRQVFGQDLDPARPAILGVGRLVELKGYQYLIESLSLMDVPRRPYLFLAGEGPLRAYLETKSRRLGLDMYVRFLGYLPPDNIPPYFAAADVFVQPSIVDRSGSTEGLGMTLIEAMACGTPCVGSATGGIPDLIRDGINGFLTEPGNPRDLAEKISCILSNSDLRQRFSEAGRQFVVENYSSDKAAAEMLAIYRYLLG